jgi:hypothetical protein
VLPSGREKRGRKLITSCCRVVKLKRGMINLLHGLFLHQGITRVVGKDLEKREEAIRQLDRQEGEEAEWAEKEIGEHEERIAKLEE